MIATNIKTATRNFCFVLIDIKFEIGRNIQKNSETSKRERNKWYKYPTVQGVPPYKPDQGGTPWNPGCLGEARQSLAFVHVRTEATPSTREGRLYGWFQGNIGGPPDTPCPDGRRVRKAKGCHHDTQF